MRIHIRGRERGVEKKFFYTLFAAWDPESRMSSMARSTGYTCTGVARCVLDGTYRHAGISAPSTIGASPGCLDRIIAHLRAREIVYEREDEL